MSLSFKSSYKGAFSVGEIVRHPKLGSLRVKSVREIRANGKTLHYEFLVFPFEEVLPEEPKPTKIDPIPDVPPHDRREGTEDRRDWTQRTWDYLRSWR